MKILLIISTILFSCLPTLCFGGYFNFFDFFYPSSTRNQNNPDEELARRTREELSERSSEAQHALSRQQTELTLPSPQDNSSPEGIPISTPGDVGIPPLYAVPPELLQLHIMPHLTPGDLSALASTSSHLRNSRVMARTYGVTSIDFRQRLNLTEEQIITGLRSYLLLENHSFIPNTRITELNLSGQIITIEILEFIVRYFPNLTSLKLRCLRKSNIQEIIRHLRTVITRLQNLNHLDFSDNGIGDLGAAALAAALTNTHLTFLNLSYNRIGDAGAQALAVLTNLTSLSLSNNRIGDAGVQAIAAALTHLTYLSLSHNNISDAGAQALVKLLTKITNFYLSGNTISPTVKQQISEQFPSKIIVF